MPRRRSSDTGRALRRALPGFALLLGLLNGCAAAGGGGAGPGSGSSHAVSDHPLLGSAAPAFEVPTPEGKGKLTLAEHSGKVVIVDFWATWCVPCRKSFPAYQKLADEFAGKLSIVAISVDEAPNDVRGFAKSTGVKFAIGWDERQDAAKSYEPPTMPTSYIVDKSGIVRFVHAGFTPGDEAGMRDEVKSLL